MYALAGGPLPADFEQVFSWLVWFPGGDHAPAVDRPVRLRHPPPRASRRAAAAAAGARHAGRRVPAGGVRPAARVVSRTEPGAPARHQRRHVAHPRARAPADPRQSLRGHRHQPREAVPDRGLDQGRRDRRPRRRDHLADDARADEGQRQPDHPERQDRRGIRPQLLLPEPDASGAGSGGRALLGAALPGAPGAARVRGGHRRERWTSRRRMSTSRSSPPAPSTTSCASGSRTSPMRRPDQERVDWRGSGSRSSATASRFRSRFARSSSLRGRHSATSPRAVPGGRLFILEGAGRRRHGRRCPSAPCWWDVPRPADLQLDDAQASKEHARIEWTGTGYAIADLGSSFGTWVNGVRVSRCELHPDGPHHDRRQPSWSLNEMAPDFPARIGPYDVVGLIGSGRLGIGLQGLRPGARARRLPSGCCRRNSWPTRLGWSGSAADAQDLGRPRSRQPDPHV